MQNDSISAIIKTVAGETGAVSGKDVCMKRGLCVLLLLMVVLLPGVGLTEDEDTMMLAKTLYTLAGDQDYQTKLMVGSVIMNRVDSVWFPDDLEKVLNQPHQFARGNRYDEDSLSAARALMMGERSLPEDVLYLRVDQGEDEWEGRPLYKRAGGYAFYREIRTTAADEA